MQRGAYPLRVFRKSCGCFGQTSEGWKHACEHLEPQIFLVA